METEAICSSSESGAESPHFDAGSRLRRESDTKSRRFCLKSLFGTRTTLNPRYGRGQGTAPKYASITAAQERNPLPGSSFSIWENDMAATSSPRNTELADLGDGLDRSDAWLFGPLIAIVVGLPIAIVALTAAGLWFAATRADLTVQRPPADTFASRWVEPPTPEVFTR
jgi:hypothetical protein